MTGVPQAYAQQQAFPISEYIRKRNTRLAIVVSAAILFLLFFGLKASGVLKFGQKPPDQATLTAIGQGPDSTLQALGKGPDSTLHASKITMPGDIEDWLRHLERCEMKKRALDKKMEEEALDMINNGGKEGMTVDDVKFWSSDESDKLPIVEKTTEILREMEGPWRNLKTEFDSVPPPRDCVPIAEAFDQGLQAIPDQMSELDKIVSGSLSQDSQQPGQEARDKARALDRGHRLLIDEPFGKTDELVAKICDKYQKHKWFSIDAHGSNKGILGH